MSIQNYSKSGTYSIGNDGGFNYHRSTQDGHGGRSQEHREEMCQIAKEVVQELAPQIAVQIYNEALQRLVGALQYDIETIVSISLEDAKNIFNSAQCRKIISDRIMKELTARLDGLEFRI